MTSHLNNMTTLGDIMNCDENEAVFDNEAADLCCQPDQHQNAPPPVKPKKTSAAPRKKAVTAVAKPKKVKEPDELPVAKKEPKSRKTTRQTPVKERRPPGETLITGVYKRHLIDRNRHAHQLSKRGGEIYSVCGNYYKDLVEWYDEYVFPSFKKRFAKFGEALEKMTEENVETSE